MKKLIKIAEYILFLMFLILVFFEKQKLTIFLTIPVILLLYFGSKKIKVKNFSLFLLIIAFLIRFISIIVLKVEVVDDFKTMLNASISLIEGDLSFMNGFYFQTYPFQLGLVLYQALLLKIVSNTSILLFMNSVITTLCVWMIYLISRNLVQEKTARVISFAYLFYGYPIYLNSVFTNQHIPLLLTLLGIYILITKEENWKTALKVATLLAFANFFRTESIVIVFGIIIYNICYIRKENWKRKLSHLGILLCTYLALTTLTTQIITHSPLYKASKESLDKNVTLWKFYCGLNDEHNGRYNDEDVQNYFSTDKEKDLVLSRIKTDYKKFPVLFLKKEVILWTQTNYDLRLTNEWADSTFFKWIQFYNQGYLNLLIVLLIISLFPKRKEEEDPKIIFVKILLATYFGIYMFIEISPRYAYNLHMFCFLILGMGLERIILSKNRFFPKKEEEKIVEYQWGKPKKKKPKKKKIKKNKKQK